MPEARVFAAAGLGAFLRAMEDPEGIGSIDAARERDIAAIERRAITKPDKENR